jgi:hypothetical protein
MGVKKSARAKAPAPAAAKSAGKAARAPKRARVTPAMGAGAFLVVIAVVAAAVMIGARASSEPAEAAAVSSPSDVPAAQPQPQPAKPKPVRAIAGTPKQAPARVRAVDAPGAVVAPKTAAELPDAVTIAGCLERSGDTFRLKDTSGNDAPKSRSWKSGFLKKSSSPVTVVDWSNRLNDHVGKRISVSGMFVDGEMRVRSLRRLAASCN